MPPKKKVKGEPEEALNTPPPKRKRAPKKKHEDEDYDDKELDSDFDPKAEAAAAPSSSKKMKGSPKSPKSPPKKVELTAQQSAALRHWRMHESVLYKITGDDPSAFKPGRKIAALDFDGTLATYKRGQQYPIDEHDWKLYNKELKKHLNILEAEGYKLVIFGNQGGVKSAMEGKMSIKARMRVEHVLEEIGLDGISVFLACQDDDFRKPNTGMWEFFVDECNGTLTEEDVQKASCFFVGDAAGRDGDFSDSDRRFAENIGIPFKLPEEVFGKPDAKPEAKHHALAPGDEGPNAELAAKFMAVADVVENVFAAAANRKVSGIIKHFGTKITAVDQLKGIKGVGKGTLDKVKEYLETGTMAILDEGNPAVQERAAVTSKNQKVAMQFL